MTHRRKLPQTRGQEEENLALEILEDKRLVRLGLNPDGNPVQNMLAVIRLSEKYAIEEKLAADLRKAETK